MIAELKARLSSELERLARELSGVSSSPTGPSGNDDGVRDMQRRARQLGQWVAALPDVDPASVSFDRVGFGSDVRLVDLDSGEEVSHTLSTGEFIDIDAGEVSLQSPIGYALAGRREGDEITVRTPRGIRHFRIATLTTLPVQLGVKQLAATSGAGSRERTPLARPPVPSR